MRAVTDLERGLIDASLGSGIYKQRIERVGGGKSGGFRTILFFRAGDRALFVYGFAKNERGNIGPDELRGFKRLADQFFALTEGGYDMEILAGRWQEVEYDGYEV